ncbi:FAD-dependent monooxygenase [Candidatus Binatia bacterium]|nr:FAD-dependent monooxygenase [Candidatus Binatia bacterium]
MPDVDVPVLIVGGGGAGLTASMLLAKLGVETLLVSALPTTSILPKAHVLNQRAMEILDDAGVANEIYARGTPPENMRYTAFYAGFAGPDPVYGKRLARLECWGAGGLDPDWASASPCLTTNLPQIRLEPLLKAHAESLAPGRVRFHHEVIDLAQDASGVTATVRDKNDDSTYTVRARYVLACDGGRTIGRKLGVEMEGVRDLVRIVSIYMTADLSRWATDDDTLIRWILLPDAGLWGTLVPMGPTRWGRHSEEWVFHLSYEHDDARAMDDGYAIARMKEVLGVPDLDAQVHVVSRWSIEGILASRFRVGRVLFVGDAAHRHPPTGGLGLTSAIHDAQNVCWKVAAVLAGHAGDGLLDSYEPERRASDGRNVQRSLENAMNHTVIGQTLGLNPSSDVDANLAVLRRALGDGPEGAEGRRSALALFATQSMEFREHAIEFGYRYQSSAVVPDGTPEPPALDDVRVYVPSTRPGVPLPHAELEDRDGARLAIKDVVRPGRFLLIAGEDGQAWIDAARSIARDAALPIDAIRIGHLDGDYRDPRCAWLRRRQFGRDGAVLVRPDRFVAWRSLGAVAQPRRVLSSALAQILDRAVA